MPVETVTDFGDYEQVEGVYLPFSTESGRKGSTDRQKVQFEKVEANPTVADSLFQFPTK